MATAGFPPADVPVGVSGVQPFLDALRNTHQDVGAFHDLPVGHDLHRAGGADAGDKSASRVIDRHADAADIQLVLAVVDGEAALTGALQLLQDPVLIGDRLRGVRGNDLGQTGEPFLRREIGEDRLADARGTQRGVLAADLAVVKLTC